VGRLARPVQHQLRRAALIFDEHILEAIRPVPEVDKRARVLSRSSARIVCDHHFPGVTTRSMATCLVGASWQHRRQDDAAGFSNARASIRQGAPVLADGPAACRPKGTLRIARGRPPVHYLVGTPKARLTRLEEASGHPPWQEALPCCRSKRLRSRGTYVLAQSLVA